MCVCIGRLVDKAGDSVGKNYLKHSGTSHRVFDIRRDAHGGLSLSVANTRKKKESKPIENLKEKLVSFFPFFVKKE